MSTGSGTPEPADAGVPERYELGDKLGSGGMATVWRAQDRALRRDVAVKVFNQGTTETPDDLAPTRATREAQILAGMNHPHLVAVLDAGGAEPDRLDYLVMELVVGPTLRDRIAQGPLTPAEVVRIGAELSSALAYVHGCDVVHRDLKPANILFDSYAADAHAKIADFGIARLLSAAPLTTSGVLVGTASYVSPEQATGVRVGTASDVYSLGLVLLECLTGEQAYAGNGVAAAAARLHHDPDVTGVRDLSTRRLLSAMTSREPDDRPDARTVADGFGAIAEGRAPELGPSAVLPDEAPQVSAAEAPTSVAAAVARDSVPAVRPDPRPAVRVTTSTSRPRRRLRLTPVTVVGALLAVLLASGATLLGSSDQAPATIPSDPSASATLTGSKPTARSSREPTSTSSSTSRARATPTTRSSPSSAPTSTRSRSSSAAPSTTPSARQTKAPTRSATPQAGSNPNGGTPTRPAAPKTSASQATAPQPNGSAAAP